MTKQRLYLTIFKGGRPMPIGFVATIPKVVFGDVEARLADEMRRVDLLQAAIESLGYEVGFSETPEEGDMAPTDRYEEV